MIKRFSLLARNGWLPLRNALWPSAAVDSDPDIQTLLSAPERYLILIFADDEGNAVGIAEASIRADYVNGTHSSPVAFLEGLYVQPDGRSQGIARELVAGVKQWAEEKRLY